MPTGKPDLVAPCLGDKQNIDSIRANIERMKKYMRIEDYRWWQIYLQDPISYGAQREQWYLDNFVKWQGNNLRAPLPDDINARSPLGLVMTHERAIPQVGSLQCMSLP